jgi:hypothetical protein
MLKRDYKIVWQRDTIKEATPKAASYFNSREKFHPILQFDSVQFNHFFENLTAKVKKIIQLKIYFLQKIICKNFHPIGKIYIFAKIFDMIRFETYEGVLFSCEDSELFVKFTIQREFKNFSDFFSCKEIKSSDYWGDIQLIGSEDEYYTWIVHVAARLLKI